ncbi:MAG: putative ABC transporter permease [Clostridia bacterium]|nr:putative ABC transporter permease [Clostridia bacterium]
MEKETKKELIKVFWIFTVASIIGCIAETIVCIVAERQFKVRQGVIYGPFIPVYGAGAVMFYLIVPKITGATTQNVKDINSIKIFLYTMFLGGITEYLFSYAQECIFGTVSWEYGDMLFNINGRTQLAYCLIWGIAGIIFIKFLYPYTEKLDHFNYMNRNVQIITGVFVLFMIFNVSISTLAGVRQYERTLNIKTNTKLEQFLDKHYPDKIMDIIFSNKKNKTDLRRVKRPVSEKIEMQKVALPTI